MSEDIQIRAARAEQLLEDEVFQEAMNSSMGDALEAAGRVDLDNAAGCIAAIAALQAIGAFQNKLRGYITAGKASERKPFKVA
jgi:hypothetical protein